MQTKIESYTKNKTHVFGILIVVFFLTLLSFYPSINNGFTNWDDNKYVTENKGLAQNKMTDYFLKEFIPKYKFFENTSDIGSSYIEYYKKDF